MRIVLKKRLNIKKELNLLRLKGFLKIKERFRNCYKNLKKNVEIFFCKIEIYLIFLAKIMSS